MSLQRGALEQNAERLQRLLKSADEEARVFYSERLDMSWIYHDSSLEGVVYTFHELQAAISNQVVSESSLIPVYDEIRQHKKAIEIAREFASRKRLLITHEFIQSIYETLAPEEAENKAAQPYYRKDIPLHRLYFHDIAPPDKILPRMKQLVQWVNSSEAKRAMHPLRLASKAHYHFLQIYPFPKYSGKVGRLLMNTILLHYNYPPAIIHATERQRYYEALKTSENAVASLVHEGVLGALESAIRFFEQPDAHSHAG